MSWHPRTLAKCAKFQSGGTPSKSNPAYWGGDIPWVGSGEMSQSFIYDTGLRLTAEGAENGTRAIPENTVLVVVRGMSLAKEFRIAITRRPMTFNQDVKALHCAEDIDPQFLFYALKARKDYIRDLATEASHGTKKLETSTLNAVEIMVPETIVGQRAVAAVALNYDDLIENNRRRIALLEEAARQLYKEWFVRFRFPGHEHVKIIDGVPEGWEKKPFSEIADVVRGRSYTSAELRDEGGRAFVNLKCINRFGGFRDSGIKGIEGDFKEKHMLVPGDIVMAVTDMTRDAMIVAQSGRISKTVDSGAIFSMDLVKIVPNPQIQRDWLYSLLRFSRFAFDVREHANGTNVLHLKPKHIEDWKGVVPPQNVREWFVEAVQVVFDQIDNLQLQSRNATKARDLLLPKLMSGAIAV